MNQIINAFSHGMKSGIDASIFPDNSWRMMRNGHIISKDERGFVVSNVKVPGNVFQLPEGYVPIGSCEFNDALYLVLYNDTNIEIGRYAMVDNVWSYRPLNNLVTDLGQGAFNIPSSLMGYNGSRLLDIIIRDGYNGGVQIYICDGINANVVINTSTIYINTTASPLTPSAIRMFNSMDSIPLISGEVINGGQLKPGSYFVSVRLVTKDYNNTIFFDQQGPFIVAGNDKGYIDKDNISLPRSIKITISDADTDYSYAEVAIMRFFGENGAVSSAVELIDRRYPINGVIIITGRESTRTLSIEELLQSNITALSCASHVQHDGRYYGGNWIMDTGVNPLVLSEIAKRIIPKYVLKNGSIEDALSDANNRDYTVMNSYSELKYKAGEAYPFGVSFIIGGKQQTDVYPVCGYDSNEYSSLDIKQILEGDYFIKYVESFIRISAVSLASYLKFPTQQGSNYDFMPDFDTIGVLDGSKTVLKLNGAFPQGVVPIIFFYFEEYGELFDIIYDDPTLLQVDAYESYYDNVVWQWDQGLVRIEDNSFAIDDPTVSVTVLTAYNDRSSVMATFNLANPEDLGDTILPSFVPLDEILLNIPNGDYKLLIRFNMSMNGETSDPYTCKIRLMLSYRGFKRAKQVYDEQTGSPIILSEPYTGDIVVKTPQPIIAEPIYYNITASSGEVSISYGEYQLVESSTLFANKGVYRFPFAKKGDSPAWRRRLFLDMIGVTFDTSIAQTFINQLDNENLNITGIVFMQGERIINFISQGISLNMIDRLASVPSKYMTHNDSKYYIYEIIALGDGESRVMIPHLSPYSSSSITLDEGDNTYKNIFTFPVNLVGWRESGDYVHPTTDHKQIAYLSPYFNKIAFPNSGLVGGGGILQHTTMYEKVYFSESSSGNPPTDNAVLLANNAMQCTRFAFISPDEINDKDGIFSGYIRSLCYIPQQDYVYSTKNKTVQKSFENTRNSKQYLYAVGNETMISNDTYFANNAIKASIVDMYRVESNRYVPDGNGCISQMKGMCEIFGDYPQTNYNTDYINANINGRSRQSLMKAGLMMNRLMFINDQSEGAMMAPRVYSGVFSQIIYDKWSTRNGQALTPLPVIITNLSMKTSGYYFFESNDAIIDDPLNGLTYAHTINEKYIYNPDSIDLYDTLKSLFEPVGSQYHSIGSVKCVQSQVYPTWSIYIHPSSNYYRGDIFAQRVAMRLNRITHVPQEGNDYKDNYHLGQMLDMYLECTINHNLRCPGDEDSFWPYASRQGFSREQFAYDSRSTKFENETVLYNEGYKQLKGISSLFGIDSDLLSPVTGKPNTVYWSNVHSSGSYEDAYRNISIGQFIDIGFESGPIRKLVSHSTSLFTIHDNGIHQLYQDNNLKLGQDGESIIIGDTGVLRNKTRPLAEYGTQHPSSIVKGSKGFYGVDWKRKKIWATSLVVSDNGTYFYNVDDLLESKSLHQAFTDMGIDNISSLSDSIFNSDDMFSGITSGYDANNGLVYFNFMVPTHGIHTLVYDERRQMFMGFHDYTPNIFMMFNGRIFMYNKWDNMNNAEGSNSYVKEPERGSDYNLYANGDQAPFVLTFYVNGSSKGLSNIEKDYILHRLFASDNILKHNPDSDFFRKIEWETEYQGSSLDLSGIETDTNDVSKFWKTPIFEEHQWKIPIDVQSSSNDGPNGTGAFTAFEPGATMRGSWLKVTIKYSGTDRIYINNCITDFLISYT